MSIPTISERDLHFQLHEMLNVSSLCSRERFADHDRDVFDAILGTAQQMAADLFAPHNAKSDQNEPTFDGEEVHIIPEVKEALTAFIEAGFMGMQHDYDVDGMQLPATVAMACNSIFTSANVGTAGYPFLTVGASNVIRSYGSESQKEKYMKPMVAGRFFGTMCLSEPQAGSSLSDIKTKAVPQDDGTYRLTGNKMWISAGEHELSENIVHLVLAKIPGGPAGVKGISLFIVPKFLVNDDGTLGERNDVHLAGLNHKMGYRGTTNTLLNFGENEGAVGYLIGEEHKGLFYMFHMMNEARIGVGLGAVSLGYAGYLYSLDYAKNRPQGRHPDGKDPTSSQLMLIEHADIKRLLLAQKAAVEGGLALCLYAARLVDEENTAEDEAARKEASLLLDMLTPVVKSWPSEFCLEANKHAIQVLGGYGYTRDYPVEQYYRDNRLNPIHEGTHGIQGLDLLGRKVMMNGGAGLKLLSSKILETTTEAKSNPKLQEFADQLEKSLHRIGEVTQTVGASMMKGEVNKSLANATIYLDMFGHAIIGWQWLKQALVADAALSKTEIEEERDFYQGKLSACQYFFRYELCRVTPWADLVESLDDTTYNMSATSF
ncbi:acyl-CoA dehydrogenase [Sneathiella sp. P13V-1]|uniref:acyl-CoA dehydrogenase n=1 Tax=Sneathiella sp. P13V-1 TaxID=2697366 RepID=UPI00187BC353|nr:acyl-CoA dehydrogenase [Sneathiella sp. P13V-1]MBE7638512.1 acyl-CoA dehydrogenase [Sneathiella sp. P13V-1]